MHKRGCVVIQAVFGSYNFEIGQYKAVDGPVDTKFCALLGPRAELWLMHTCLCFAHAGQCFGQIDETLGHTHKTDHSCVKIQGRRPSRPDIYCLHVLPRLGITSAYCIAYCIAYWVAIHLLSPIGAALCFPTQAK